MKRENEHKEYCEQDIVDQISRMSEDTEVPDSLRSENIDKLLEKKKQKKHFRGSGSDSRCGRCLWPFWSISGKSVSDSSDRGYTGAAV